MNQCEYSKATEKPNTYECTAGHHGGLPHVGVCMVCEHYEGPARGTGDLIAKMTRAVGIKHCGTPEEGCEKRRRKLNKALPFKGGVTSE